MFRIPGPSSALAGAWHSSGTVEGKEHTRRGRAAPNRVCSGFRKGFCARLNLPYFHVGVHDSSEDGIRRLVALTLTRQFSKEAEEVCSPFHAVAVTEGTCAPNGVGPRNRHFPPWPSFLSLFLRRDQNATKELMKNWKQQSSSRISMVTKHHKFRLNS